MKKIYILAAVLAVVTGILAFIWFTRQGQVPQEDMVSVVVAATDIPSRMPITRDMLVLRDLPADAVHPQAAVDPDALVGLMPNGPILKDETILLGRLIRPGEKAAGFTGLIPAGRRAFTLFVDEMSGVANLIRPGDRVDVYISVAAVEPAEAAAARDEQRNPTGRTFSRLLLQDIEVLAIGSKSAISLASEIEPYQSVTLALLPGEGNQLNLALVEGRARLVLRPVGDAGTVPGVSENTDDLLGFR